MLLAHAAVIVVFYPWLPSKIACGPLPLLQEPFPHPSIVGGFKGQIMGFVWYEELCRCYRVLTSKDKIESPNLNTLNVNLTKSRSSLATVSMLAINPPNFLFKKVATSRSVSCNTIKQLPVLGIRKIAVNRTKTNMKYCIRPMTLPSLYVMFGLSTLWLQ